MQDMFSPSHLIGVQALHNQFLSWPVIQACTFESMSCLCFFLLSRTGKQPLQLSMCTAIEASEGQATYTNFAHMTICLVLPSHEASSWDAASSKRLLHQDVSMDSTCTQLFAMMHFQKFTKAWVCRQAAKEAEQQPPEEPITLPSFSPELLLQLLRALAANPSRFGRDSHGVLGVCSLRWRESVRCLFPFLPASSSHAR